MANLNVAMVMGRLVADPDFRYSPNGIPVCRLQIATTKKFKKPDGTTGESTLFVEVDTWRRQAEICAQFLKKGRDVFVSGELVQHRDPKNGSRIKISADTVQFIGAPKACDEDGEETES